MTRTRTGEHRWPMATAVLLTGLLRTTLPPQLRLNDARPVLFVVLLGLVVTLTLTDPARMADRACGCPGRPAFVVIMPSVPSRPYPVDLLLCRRHYRVSAGVLEAAGAGVFGTDGMPMAGTSLALVRTSR